MGLVKTRRLATMQKQQRAKAGVKQPRVKYGLNNLFRKDKNKETRK